MRHAAAVVLMALAACGGAGPSQDQVATAARARMLLEGNTAGLVYYSIGAAPSPPGGPERPKLHGWTVQNRTPVKDASTAARLRQVLSDPATYDNKAIPCFRPGLAFTFEGPRPADFVVCLECKRIDAFHDGRQVESLLLSTEGVARLKDIYEVLSAP